jgi:hypothetical protein
VLDDRALFMTVSLDQFLFLLAGDITRGLCGDLSAGNQGKFWSEIGRHEDYIEEYAKEFPAEPIVNIDLCPNNFSNNHMGYIPNEEEKKVINLLGVAWAFCYASYLLVMHGPKGAERRILEKRYK